MNMASQEGFIDGHCHLTDPRYEPIVEHVIAQSHKLGVSGFVLGGTCPTDWQRQIQLRASHPTEVYPVLGIHPWQTLTASAPLLADWLHQLEVRAGAAVALGEIGLDRGSSALQLAWQAQQELFAGQLTLAAHLNLPVVLHVVKAHNEVIAMLKQHQREHKEHTWRGVIHGFHGSVELARSYLDLGYLLGMGVATTLQHPAPKLWQFLPDDGFMLESDAPGPWYYDAVATDTQVVVADQQLTTPGIITAIATTAAALKGRLPAELLTQSSHNIRRVFPLQTG